MKRNRMNMAAGALLMLAAGCSAPPREVRHEAPLAPKLAASAEQPVPEEDLLLLVTPDKPDAKPPTTGVLRLAAGAPVAQLTADDTRIEAKVYGPVAQVTVRQTFRNTTGQTVDADWLLPVPRSAVVMDLTVDLGDRHFRAVMVEEAKAKELYAAALKQGRHAAMVHAEDAGWRLRLGRVRAGERVGAGVVYGEVREMDIPSGKGEYVAVSNGERVAFHWDWSIETKQVRNPVDGTEKTEWVGCGGETYFSRKACPGAAEEHVEAFAVLSALEAQESIGNLRYEDHESGHPDHAAEILALARKHKILVPGLSFLMVDAKKQ